jgi:hypothetical protein
VLNPDIRIYEVYKEPPTIWSFTRLIVSVGELLKVVGDKVPAPAPPKYPYATTGVLEYSPGVRVPEYKIGLPVASSILRIALIS